MEGLGDEQNWGTRCEIPKDSKRNSVFKKEKRMSAC